MTAEIAILNKSAVALAADSAVTIGQRKVYNSANKLFTLSKVQPVGVMIFGNADIMGVPWETIIKYYRGRHLQSTSFPTLKEYKEHFVNFLRTTTIFSEVLEEHYARQIIAFHLTKIREDIQAKLKELAAKTNPFTDADVASSISTVIKSWVDEGAKRKYLDQGSDGLVENFKKKRSSLFEEGVSRVFQKTPLTKKDKAGLFQVCADGVFKDKFYGFAGVVIAGFGETEIYPALESFLIEGRAGEFLKCRDIQYGQIDSIKRTAWIVPFAQSEMVSTFMDGIHPGLRSIIWRSLGEMFERLPTVLFPDDKTTQDAIAAQLTKISRDFGETWDEYAKKNFINDIMDSVGALPKDELAAMAEALVNLTSFRRRVTMDQETVGGPIDVAVISKGDGFIWIKRKHYFDPKLNQHFSANYFREV